MVAEALTLVKERDLEKLLAASASVVAWLLELELGLRSDEFVLRILTFL